MIRRLVDAHYDEFHQAPNDDQIRFWLRESRSPEVLIALAADHRELLGEVQLMRPLLTETIAANSTAIQRELVLEELKEKQIDEAYWLPLKRELEALRRKR